MSFNSIAKGLLFWLVFLGISILAIALRCWNLGESLWIDELHTSWTVAAGFDEVASRAAWGNQPPLYFWLTKVALQLFGLFGQESEAALRSISFLAGIATLSLLARFAFQLTNSRHLSLLALLAAAIDVEMVFYSQEARPYALVQFFVLVHAYALFRRCTFFRRDEPSTHLRIWRVTWGVSLWCAFFTHYTSLIILPFELLLLFGWWIVSRLSSRKEPCRADRAQRAIVRCGIDLMWVIPGLLLSAPHVINIFSRQTDWSVLMQTWPIPTQIAKPVMLYAVPGLLLLLIACLPHVSNALRQGSWRRRFFKKARLETRTNATDTDARRLDAIGIYFVWGLSIAMTLVAIWCGTRFLDVSWFLPRYLISLLPLAILWAVMGWRIVRADGRLPYIGIAIWIVLISFENQLLNSSWPSGRLAIARGENWRKAIDALPPPAQTQQPLYLFSNLVEDDRLNHSPSPAFIDYMQFAVSGMYRLPAAEEGWKWAVVPKAAYGEPVFLPAEVRSILDHRQATLIIRGRPSVVEHVLAELAESLAPYDKSFDATVDDYGGVFVVSLQLIERSELESSQAD